MSPLDTSDMNFISKTTWAISGDVRVVKKRSQMLFTWYFVVSKNANFPLQCYLYSIKFLRQRIFFFANFFCLPYAIVIVELGTRRRRTFREHSFFYYLCYSMIFLYKKLREDFSLNDVRPPFNLYCKTFIVSTTPLPRNVNWSNTKEKKQTNH